MSWREATWGVWSALALLLVACQLAASIPGGRFPGAGALLRMLTASPVRRAVLLVGWLWLGWHTFAR